MRRRSLLLAFTLIIAVPVAANGQTRYIGDITQGSLIGPVTSSAQLQTDFVRNDALIAQASARLGLAPSEYRLVRDAIERGDARYVVLPRHLDGMSGERHGVAFAVHDIDIPAGVHGWEVDIERPTALVRVFVPNACGNISYLLVPHRALAAAPPRPAPPPLALWSDVPDSPRAPLQLPPPSEDIAVAPPIVAAAAGHSIVRLLALIPLVFLGGATASVPIGPAPPGPPPAHRPIGILIHVPIVSPTPTACPPPLKRAPRLPSRPE